MIRRLDWSVVILVGCLLSAVRLPAADPAPIAPASYRNAVVAADHPAASRAGVEILKSGGNVVDAAVATGFVLSVVRPRSSGLGGGGFMVIHFAESRRSVALDYREVAPRAATRTMFVDPANPKRAIPAASRFGHLAVAVPGHVAGLCYALEHYGSLDLKTVLAPAIRLAREGIVLEAHDRQARQGVAKRVARLSDGPRRFAALWEQYLNRGRPFEEGQRITSPQLAVLERIAAHGRDGFYTGPVARALVAESRRGGGLLTLDDLARVNPTPRRPLEGRLDSLKFLTMPPPSSGGVALVEMANIHQAYQRLHPAGRRFNGPEYLHVLVESMKHAFADRAAFLGDADVVDVPTQRLISPEYARVLARRIDPRKTRPLKAYGRHMPVDDSGTSHFSIIDRHGNAVACTETINSVFGSLVVEPKYGIVLNNEMDDFAALPGQPNQFGLVESEANAVAPGKRPLSSMTPTIALADGKAVQVLGASGGPRIISTTFQVFLNLNRQGMNARRAVATPRIHHQWLPNAVYAEQPLFGRHRAALEAFGHAVRLRNNLAACQVAIRNQQGLLEGASDRRKHGRAAGY